MKKFILLFLVLSTHLFADSMVFLVEGDHGKQVGYSEDFNGYVELTSGKGWSLYPAISSDGKKVAYVRGSGPKDLEVVIKDLKNKSERVVSEKGFILHPRFSNNGNTLFVSKMVGEVNKIGIIDLNNKKTQYLDSQYSAYFPAPFQSGEMLVFQRNAKVKEIVIKDLISNKEEVIGLGMSPSLSKDERYIAYTSEVNENWDVYIYDRFTKKTIKVTSNDSKDFSPVFDRFSNLIYTSDRLENGVFSIFKQEKKSWLNQLENEELLISKEGVSFYAPRVSGIESYNIRKQENMIGEPRSSFGTIVSDSKIYVIGGHQGPEHTYPPESFTSRVTSYDILLKKWNNLAPRINASHGFQLAQDEDSIYAFGGFTYEETTNPKWKSISVVESYDVKNNEWKEIGNMPRNRSSNVAMRVKDKVYLIGGWDSTPKHDGDFDGTFHDEIDVYDIKTNTWSTLEVKLPKKRRAFSAFVRNDKIYLLGGISAGGSHFSLLDDFTEFDPKTNTFKELPKLPFATFAPASESIGDKAYIFGGMFKTGKMSYEYVPHIYEYDFSKNDWSHTGRYLSEAKGFSQTVKLYNCIGILGGHSYKNNSDSPVETFETFCSK